jgi:hypothetical protein
VCLAGGGGGGTQYSPSNLGNGGYGGGGFGGQSGSNGTSLDTSGGGGGGAGTGGYAGYNATNQSSAPSTAGGTGTGNGGNGGSWNYSVGGYWGAGGGGGGGGYGGGGGGSPGFPTATIAIGTGGGGGSIVVSNASLGVANPNYTLVVNPLVPTAGTATNAGATLITWYNASLSQTNPALYVTGDIYAQGGVCYANGDLGYISNIPASSYSPSLFQFSNSGLYRAFAYSDTVPGVYSDTTFAVTSNTAVITASANGTSTIAWSLSGISNLAYVYNASVVPIDAINWRVSQLL